MAEPVRPTAIFKTPQVAALEARVAELERENEFLRQSAGAWDMSIYSHIGDLTMNSVALDAPDIRLPKVAEWRMKRSWLTGRLHAVGSCRVEESPGVGDTDIVAVEYFHEIAPITGRQLGLEILGRLHERLIERCAQLWWQK